MSETEGQPTISLKDRVIKAARAVQQHFSPNKAALPSRPDNISQFDRTILLEKRLLNNSEFYEEPDGEAPHGIFQGRRIIGRDNPINGGVYLGSGQREAIVVDDQKDPTLRPIYDELVREVLSERARTGKSFKDGVLTDVYNKVLQYFKYGEQVEEIAKKFSKDQKVYLGYFIRRQAGICRHRALLTAYLLEKLTQEGYVRGRVSIDRNTVRGRGGHAWARYTSHDGTVFILDPTQHYIGTLKDAEKRGNGWFYKRPDDR